MTCISSKHLLLMGEMCHERIGQEIHGYTVFVFAVIFTLLVVKSVPLLKYIYDKMHEHRGLDREAMLTIEQGRLDAYNVFKKDPKNKDIAAKRRWKN